MKFELVDFYPITDKNRGNLKKNALGTVHLYVIDLDLDIRGIRVNKQGKNIHFYLPHCVGFDNETGEKIRYPVISWTNKENHKEMMDFLHQQVKPEILGRLTGQK